MRALAFWTAIVLLGVMGASATFAQTAVVISPVARQQFLDASGAPLAGGKICTYAAGTTTPQVTYNDKTGTYQNSNPVILDGGGFATIFIVQGESYKFVAYDQGTDSSCSTGTMQWSVDGIPSTNAVAVGTVNVNGAPVINANFIDSPGGSYTVDGSDISFNSTRFAMQGASMTVENGNFELPNFSTTEVMPPFGWSDLGADTGSQSLDTVNPPPNVGFSYKQTCDMNGPDCISVNSSLTNVYPGEHYTVMASVRSDGTAPAAVCVEFAQGGGSVINVTDNCQFTLSTSWTQLVVTGTVAANQDYGRVILADTNSTSSLSSGVAGSMWFQNVQSYTDDFPAPIISTVATGTAPIVVASTTNVANLDASSIESGKTFESPGNIGGGTPGQGLFSLLHDTSLTLDGCVSVSSGVLVSLGNPCGATVLNKIVQYLSVPVTLNEDVLTTVINIPAFSMPATGCPCSLGASYTAYWQSGGVTLVSSYVETTDGSNIYDFAGAEHQEANSVTSESNVHSDITPGSYANGAMVQATLYMYESRRSPSVTVNVAPTNVGPNSNLKIWVMTSNN